MPIRVFARISVHVYEFGMTCRVRHAVVPDSRSPLYPPMPGMVPGEVFPGLDAGWAGTPAGRANSHTDGNKHPRPVVVVRVAGVRLRTPVRKTSRRGPKTDPSHPGLPPKSQVS